MEDSFLDDCPKLLFLHTHNCAEDAVTNKIPSIKESQYKNFRSVVEKCPFIKQSSKNKEPFKIDCN